jgi:hypothetical protein
VTEAEIRITPANPRAAFGHLADQVVEIVEERGGAGQKVLARRGEADLAGGALKKPDTKPRLKLGHVFRGQPVRHAHCSAAAVKDPVCAVATKALSSSIRSMAPFGMKREIVIPETCHFMPVGSSVI